MKKLLSVVLSVVMLLTAALPLAAAAASTPAAECNCEYVPLVYVVGQSQVYADKDDPNSPHAYHASKEEITQAVKDVLPVFAKAVVTQNWDDYCDALYEAVSPFFADYVLSDEGTVKNNSGVKYTWDESTISRYHGDNSVYRYEFRYDPRLDPWEIADNLNEYIEAVKKVTGHDTVCLLSRCMGTDIMMSYLVKYAAPNNFEGMVML